ncbi:MAG: glycosyltransferase family 4 protein [Sulfuritalea sp.]|nr:glycosyltransferase family 4 protein [Sulfuritalea sp.]
MTVLPFLAFAVSAGLLAWLLRSGRAHRWALDQPNHRSLHTEPTPRVGGLGIVAGVLLATVWLGQGPLAGLVLLLATVSWFDDRGHVSILVRLGVQFLATIVWVVVQAPDGWLLGVAAVLTLVWMANLYNFMDGSDGLAGGMAVFGFGAYGIAAWLAGDGALALLAFSVAAAVLGFLCLNFPPARAFMGDAGSIPLGFLAGAIGLTAWLQDVWPVWFPLLVFSSFVVDASVTLLKRVLRREKFWIAHREHYYQRIVRMGWSHRRLALAEYALMAACGSSALGLLHAGFVFQILGLSVWVAIYAGLMLFIDRCWANSAASGGDAA